MDGEESVGLRAVVQEHLESVGASELVPATVQSVDAMNDELVVYVQLRYQKDKPVCCGEPTCYVPFLRPAGLVELERSCRYSPGIPMFFATLRLVVSCVFESGFQFVDQGLGLPKTWSAEYTVPGPTPSARPV